MEKREWLSHKIMATEIALLLAPSQQEERIRMVSGLPICIPGSQNASSKHSRTEIFRLS